MDESTIEALKELTEFGLILLLIVLNIYELYRWIEYDGADIDFEALEEEAQRALESDVRMLSEVLQVDERKALEIRHSLGRAGIGYYIEIKKVGDKYEFLDSKGRGYFWMKDGKVEKAVLADALLIENGRALPTPKINEDWKDE